MKCKLSGLLLMLLPVFLLVFPSMAFDESNPDSPSPVLVSGPEKSRVLAVDASLWDGSLPSEGQEIFLPGQRPKVVLFLKNLALLESEGANSIRAYLVDSKGKAFRLPSESLIPISKTAYAFSTSLYDEEGLRGQPAANGDAFIFVTWRGMKSNALKIGLGRKGGKIALPDALNLENKSEIQTSEAIGPYFSGDRVRFMEQAAFGPSPELDARIRRVGNRVWIAEQFDAPYPTFPYPEFPLMPTVPPSDCTQASNPSCFRDRYTLDPLQKWFFIEALYGNSQLRHRVAWALSQILVTSGIDIQQSSHMIAYHKVLSQNAFGNYRNLLMEMTLNPAMGAYLDMARSTKTNPNENYPREILQLFSIGLFKLNLDGTLQRDQNNNPIASYTQEDINNFSKVFTGWSFCNVGCPNSTVGAVNFKDPMIVSPSNHDLSAKTLLNYQGAPTSSIAACTNCATPAQTVAYADDSLNRAIDNIFNHPNVGPFIGKLLIQHLVMSDPSPAYVQRVASAFNNNGQNIRGDMKAVVRAILLDPEARGNIKTDPRYGKLREPVQLFTNLGRLYNARSWLGDSISDGALSAPISRMGQNPFYSPTVFNYFPPDYLVPNTTLIGPEFAILNTGSSISRVNTVNLLVFDGITPNATDSLRGTSLDLSEVRRLSEADPTGNLMLDTLNQRMLHGAMSAPHKNAVLGAISAIPASNSSLRAKTAVYLIAVSSQYQVQR